MKLLALLAIVAAAHAAFLSGPLQRPHPTRRAHRAASATMSTKGVVITGGAGGVGYAYADELMRQGHWVVICDVKDPSAAVETLRQKYEGGEPAQSELAHMPVPTRKNARRLI